MWYHLLHEPQQNQKMWPQMLMKQGIRATVYHAGLKQ